MGKDRHPGGNGEIQAMDQIVSGGLFTSKHLEFLSFQIILRIARKEILLVILPLSEQKCKCQASKSSLLVLGKVQPLLNQLSADNQKLAQLYI